MFFANTLNPISFFKFMGFNVNKLLSDTNNKEFQLPLAP